LSHISPAASAYQVGRVARERNARLEKVRALVAQYSDGRTWGILGDSRVNVLRLNLALMRLSECSCLGHCGATQSSYFNQTTAE